MALTRDQLTPLVDQDMSWSQMLDVLGCSYGQLQYWMGKYQLKTKWMERRDQNKLLYPQELKICSTCNQPSELESYPKDPRSSDGCTSECGTCARTRTAVFNRDSYQADPEPWKARGKEWRSRNKAWMKKYMAEYHKAHKEERREYLKAWFKRNPGMAKVYRQQREGRKRGAAGTFTKEQLISRIEFYGGRCYLCGCDWYALPKVDQTIDHVKSLVTGGSNWPANLRPACRSCNSAKH